MYRPGHDLARRYPEWTVIRRPLHGAYGVMLYRRQLIIIDSDGTRPEWDCTLAHEIVHLDRRDRCTLGNAVVDQRQELAVCRLAAGRMLPIERLCEVELFGRYPADLADELGVDIDTLRTRIASMTDYERDLINQRRLTQEEGAA